MKVLGLNGYIRSIQNRIKDQRALDVGCCSYYEEDNLKNHKAYAKTARALVGVDINSKLLLDGQTNNPDLDLYMVDFTSPFLVGHFIPKVGQFQHIIATNVLEYIDDARHFIKNLHLAGTPQARLYLTTPNARSPYWWKAFRDQKGAGVINSHQVAWYDTETLDMVLFRQGFEIEELCYCTDDEDKKAAESFGLDWQVWMARLIFVVVKKKGVNNE